MPTIHLLIKGRVQGVFYRASAREEAERTGIKGWIKNTPEGHVEALVSGTESQLEAFTKWCKRGPDKARVDEVLVTEETDNSFDEFTIIR